MRPSSNRLVQISVLQHRQAARIDGKLPPKMTFDHLIANLRDLDHALKQHVVRTANTGLTLRNWLVGAYLVEYEQHGEERAEYGEKLIPRLADELALPGLTPTNLRLCRSLYLDYPEIQQTVSVELGKAL